MLKSKLNVRSFVIAAGIGALFTISPAKAEDASATAAYKDIQATLGSVPDMFKTLPDAAVAGAWGEIKGVQLNPKTALDGKTKELMGLAVASQIPCKFCIIAHTEFAKLNGATDAEIKEAIGMASLTRDMSTLLNGMQVDEGQFRRDIDRLVKGAKAAAARTGSKTNPATAQR